MSEPQELEWIGSGFIHNNNYRPLKKTGRLGKRRLLVKVFARNPKYPGRTRVRNLISKPVELRVGKYWKRVHNHIVAMCNYEKTKPLLENGNQEA